MSDVYSFWQFVTAPPFGPSVKGLRDDVLSVNWFVPPLSAHSGGHINLFRFAIGLEARGFQCHITIVNDGVSPSDTPLATLKEQIQAWYGPFGGQVHYADDELPPVHVAMATGWQTAYRVNRFRGAALKGYFVQDFEPDFFPVGSEYAFAEATYRMGLVGFTAGSWLATKLRGEYGMPAHALGMSYDKALYRPAAGIASKAHQLLVYVRPETARRGWELCLLTLANVHRARPDIGFVLAGAENDGKELPFPATFAGRLTQDELPDLYARCDAALVLSLTNLSLLPLELMACGVPVISNRGPNVDWLLNDSNAVLCDANPDSLSRGVLQFYELEPAKRQALSDRATAQAQRTDWEKEIDKMASLLRATLNRHELPGASAALLPGRAARTQTGPVAAYEGAANLDLG